MPVAEVEHTACMMSCGSLRMDKDAQLLSSGGRGGCTNFCDKETDSVRSRG